MILIFVTVQDKEPPEEKLDLLIFISLLSSSKDFSLFCFILCRNIKRLHLYASDKVGIHYFEF